MQIATNQGAAAALPTPVVGRAPGIVLALLACPPVAGVLLVAQVLPQFTAAFAGTPNLEVQIAVALTVPALAIALFASPCGWLADRVGKRRLLLWSLFFYSLLGVLPVMLNDLGLIILARAGTGVTEAIIMTCSTALIGDLYPAGRREGILSLQTACASVAAVLFAGIGGALGDLGWRAPFAVYALALFYVPAIMLVIPATAGKAADATESSPDSRRSPLPLAPLLGLCGITFILGIGFYVAQVQTAFLLNAIGSVAPSTVGLVSAITNAAVVVGSFFFALLRRKPVAISGSVFFLLMAIGLMVAGLAGSFLLLAVGLAIAGFAGGIALPTLTNAVMSILEPEQRGVGIGIWQSSFWAAQFFSPILVIALTGAAGGLQNAVLVIAAASALTIATMPLFRSRA